MDNKKVLSKLIKIASNQQAILNKLAQAQGAPDAADAAMSDFVKYQFTSWAMPLEIAGRSSRSVERDSAKHFNVNVVVTLSNPEQKKLVEDPINGFAAWLNKKFTTASSVDKWKSLAGFTADFNVTTN